MTKVEDKLIQFSNKNCKKIKILADPLQVLCASTFLGNQINLYPPI